MLLTSTERFSTRNQDYLVRVRIFTDIVADVGTHIKICARFAGVIVKLMSPAFAILKKRECLPLRQFRCLLEYVMWQSLKES